MAEQNERSAEDFAKLAVEDTAQWLKEFLHSQAQHEAAEDDEEYDEDDEGEYYSEIVNDTDSWRAIEPMHGLKLYEVYSEGGHEGGGEHAEVVFAIAPPDSKRIESPDGHVIEGALTYFRLCGYYSSYEGTEWNELTDIVTVYPREVKVIRFFKGAK